MGQAAQLTCTDKDSPVCSEWIVTICIPYKLTHPNTSHHIVKTPTQPQHNPNLRGRSFMTSDKGGGVKQFLTFDRLNLLQIMQALVLVAILPGLHRYRHRHWFISQCDKLSPVLTFSNSSLTKMISIFPVTNCQRANLKHDGRCKRPTAETKLPKI